MATSPSLPFLDDLQTGVMLPELTYKVTQDLVDAYGMASLDLNPVHMDPAWCERARVFGTPLPVAHGMMSMSFMASAIYRAWGALADIARVESKFTKPCPIGTTVTVRAMVRDTHPLGSGNGYVTLTVDAIDQANEVIGVSEIDVRLPRLPGAKP
ncbi:MAG: MaoC family dehydratase [Dehalococcoidia bacterium]|nr:MaoC family dehydratase [Dehalococcoidia bacterium]NUQ55441.1 MaoC family dehydratase [Dehalococcoidia bacterium]